MKVSISNAGVMRAMKDDPSFENAELYPGMDNGHKFHPGQKCILVGLQDFPEYNGDRVKITAIREDGPRGKAYYFEGRMNEIANWIYEIRLSPAADEG